MRYEIRRFQNGSPEYDSEFWPDSPLVEVKQYGESVIATGLADRVAVYDGNGNLVMNIPRTLSPG